jgi:hypothetical protein
MQKLQMAAHAIGDIEALLQGSDVDGDGEGDSAESFEGRILSLVIAALAKRNVDRDVALTMQSIEDAKRELEREEANINTMLGSMDGTGYVGPRAPTLPQNEHSMEPKTFALSALRMLGTSVREERPGIFLAESKDSRERIHFDDVAPASQAATLYAPQTPAFQRLVKRSIASGLHNVFDAENDIAGEAERTARNWVEELGAEVRSLAPNRVHRSFNGKALLRVRATVAHDSYERLVPVDCRRTEHTVDETVSEGLVPLPKSIRDPSVAGIDRQRLIAAGENDDAIAEFRRFYEERRELEVQAAGTDARKRKKLEDDFTPRLEMTLVGLEGEVHRNVVMRATYGFEGEGRYESEVTVRPHSGDVVKEPEMDLCSKTGRTVPKECLGRCEMTGATALRHLLGKSEVSGRSALPEYIAVCSFSGKNVLQDELEASSVTGRPVASSLLKTSAVSANRAEPDQFGTCAFTGVDALKSELAVSQISGKSYRSDEEAQSESSARTGHASEFIKCRETKQLIAPDEAETCEVTLHKVKHGVLAKCEATGKRVLPSWLGTCVASHKRVLRELLVTSSISQATILKDEAIRSIGGNFCLPSEARTCSWSDRLAHPDDLKSCALTGLPIHVEFAASEGAPKLRPLAELLDGVRRNTDEDQLWGQVAERIASASKARKCRVEAAILSPSKRHLATCAESKSFLGLRVSYVGAIYDLVDSAIVGRVPEGKRSGGSWSVR